VFLGKSAAVIMRLMENNVSPNSAITASSIWGSARESWRARLNNVPNGHTGSWSAATNQIGEWLQIDLGRDKVVTKLATQGRPPMVLASG